MNATKSAVCPTCDGEEWVCENHPDKPWREKDGCECGAGMLCRTCMVPAPRWQKERESMVAIEAVIYDFLCKIAPGSVPGTHQIHAEELAQAVMGVLE